MVGINWGLPNTVSWMSDALAPYAPLIGLSKGFSFGYFNKYPLVHQLILAILYIPVVIYAIIIHAAPSGFQLAQFLFYVRSPEFATILIYIGRIVSVFMGLGVVYYVYKAVCELFGKGAGLWAATLLSFNTVLNFYSHTSKVEVPHIFWAMASIYYLIRVVKYNTTRDFVLTAVFSCLSFGTKDQAYAIFVLPFIFYLFILPAITAEKGRKLSGIFKNKKLLIFIAVFVVGTLLVENILLNWEGFLYRFKHLTGEGGTRSISYTLTPSGIYFLWHDVFREIMIDAMGIPILFASIVGIGIMFFVKEEREKGLLLRSVFLIAMLSFMLFFVQVIRQSSIRFCLIQSILLTAYGGYAVDYIWRKTIKGSLKKKILAAILVAGGLYSFYNTVSVNANLLGDPRYKVEQWMSENLEKDVVVEFFSAEHFVPRFPDWVETRRIKTGFLEIENRKPDYLVLNSNMINSNKGYLISKSGAGRMLTVKNLRSINAGEPYFVELLLDNQLPYREVFRSYSKRSFFRRHKAVNINADYIVIYKRI